MLLYELLTGMLPFNREKLKHLRQADPEQIYWIITAKEPPPPSKRMLHVGEEATKAALKRGTNVKFLIKRLRRELELIPLKAIRREPAQRYRTASELAADVSNYLQDQPLLAGFEYAYIAKWRMRRMLKRWYVTGPVISIVLLALFLPYIWMGQLTKKVSLDAGRARAEALMRRHFQIEKPGETTLPVLGSTGAVLDPNDTDIRWIRFSGNDDKPPVQLSSQQKEMIEALKIAEDRDDRLVLKKEQGRLWSNYIKVFKATDSCISCHNPQRWPLIAFSRNEPIGAVMIRRPAGEISTIALMNRICIIVAAFLAGLGVILTFHVIKEKSAPRLTTKLPHDSEISKVYFVVYLLTAIGLYFILPAARLIRAPYNYAGILLIVAGVGLNIWADRLFHKKGTPVKPIERASCLLEEGPFVFTRNPMYLGMAMILVGTAVVLGNIASFAAPVAFLITKKALEDTFGPEYLDYKKRVRRWL
jgi:protein-S-isoprenylcysteine O-methyltransferase Ste14